MTTKHTLKSLLSEQATAMAMLNDALGRGEVDEGYGLLSSVSDICEIHSARTFLEEKRYKAEIAEELYENAKFKEENAKLKAEIAELKEQVAYRKSMDELREGMVVGKLKEIAKLNQQFSSLQEVSVKALDMVDEANKEIAELKAGRGEVWVGEYEA